MNKQNNNGLGLTQPQSGNRCFVSRDLRTKATHSDTSALFDAGIVFLINKKVGFAERSFYFAARAGHPKADRAVALLRDYDTVSKWRDTVLYLFNNSIL